MHEVEVLLHVKIGISEDKKVTLGNIATTIRNLGIEPKITEQIVQTLDENEVERHCGGIYQRGNGGNRYQRGGTSVRESLYSGAALCSLSAPMDVPILVPLMLRLDNTDFPYFFDF